MSDRRPDLVDLLRSAGGLLLASGVVVLLSRKSTSDLARALVSVVPAVVLYMISVLAPPAGEDGPRPWRSLVAVAAVLLAPVAMIQLLHLLGADTSSELWLAAVFASTSLLATHAARGTGAPYLVLLGALSALTTWLVLWQLADPSPATFRWLLIVAAVLLLGVARALARRGASGAREVATVGGLAAVLPGVIGIVTDYVALIGNSLDDVAGGPGRIFGATGHSRGLETVGWDVYLLLASVLLVWAGVRVRSRGLGYVGALGIFTFLLGVGSQLTRLAAGRPPQAGVAGWPIALIVTGGVALLLPVILRRDPP